MKCEECNSDSEVIRIKHIPFTNVSGHVTLSNHTNLCPTCIFKIGEEFSIKFKEVIDKHKGDI